MSRQCIAAFVTVVAALVGVAVSAQHPRSVTIVSTAAPDGWQVSRLADGRPDLQGVWANDTATPLQRPDALADRATLTDEEVAALQTHAAEILGAADDALFGDQVFLKALASLEGQPPAARYPFYSYGQQWMGHRWLDNRTSLIIDPPNGRLPPPSAEAEERRMRQREARRSADARRPKSTARSGRRESPNNEPFGQLRHGPRSSEHDPCATRDLVGVGRTRRPRGLDFATGIHLTEALDLSK